MGRTVASVAALVLSVLACLLFLNIPPDSLLTDLVYRAF
jgi:hypothetical protein